MIKLGRSFYWILLLMGLSFVVTLVPDLSENPIYARLTIVLGIILAANALWTGLALIGVDMRRSTRTSRKQVGEVFTENFEVVNHSALPKVWLKVTDGADLPGGSGSRVLTWMGSRQSRPYVSYSLLQRRGWFKLGPSTIESGDIFGLFIVSKRFESRSRLLVIPYTVPIQAFPAPYGILPGGRALRQKTLEVTSYAAGVREYVPGDPLRRIHWPTSARKQKLIVKEFEKDPLAEVWIFLDVRAAVHCHKSELEEQRLTEFWWVKERREFHLPPHTEEYAITIAASIGKYYVSQKREVGLVAAGQNYTILPPERGERQLGKLLETLAVLRAEGDMPLWGLISSQLGHLARGSTVVLITPASDEKLLTVVMELIQRGLMPVVILIDQSTFGGEGDYQPLQSKLVSRGIFTFVVREGDDIKAVLETPNLVFDGRMVFRGL